MDASTIGTQRRIVKQKPKSWLVRYGFAVVATAATFAIALLLQALSFQNRFLLFFGTVALTTWFGGLGPGLLSTVLSVLGIDLFFLSPQAILAPDDIPRFALFAAIAVLISSITESQRRAQKGADEQREWFRTTLASIGDAVIATDTSGRVTFMNPVAEALTGWRQTAALGKGIEDIFHIVNASTRIPAENPVVRVLREGVVTGLANHTVLIDKSGNEFLIDDSGAPIRDYEQKITGAVLVFRDVSEQTKARQIEVQLAAIVKSSEDAIIGLDLAGVITSWNLGAERMYGYASGETIGHSIAMLIPPDWPNDVAYILEQIKRGESVEHYETKRMRKDGAVLDVSLTVSNIHDAEGKVIGASKIARDITAQRRAEMTQRFLAEATVTLSSSMNYEETLKELAHLMVPVMADWCSVHILEDNGRLRAIDVVSNKPERLEILAEIRRRYPFDPAKSGAIAQVISSGETLYIPDVDTSTHDQYGRDEEHVRLIASLQTSSSIVVALRVGQRVLGVISLSLSAPNRHYDEADVATAEEIAHRAAIAIENAQLYHDAEQARQAAEESTRRISRLQSLTAALSESLTPAEVASVIINQGVAVLDAAAGSVALLDADHTTIRIINSIGYTEPVLDLWRTFPIDTLTPIAETIRTSKPIWLESPTDRQNRYPILEDQRLVQTDYGSWASLPLLVEGQTIGALGLSFPSPRQFNERDQSFMMTLAHHCAQAIHRARLYEAEQRALTAAEAAIRVRDEFLSVAAHELRTPITSLRGFGQMLTRQMNRDGVPDPTRLRKVLEAVDQQSIKLTALVSQLLDVSRLETGRLVLEPQPTDITSLVQEVVERTQTGTVHHTLTAEIAPDVRATVDPLRLEQVLTNLLDNAVKYSPDGGPIDVEMSVEPGNSICICVTDHGIGIPPEHRANIFDKFYQVQTNSIQGMGLGLFISREIISLHGGSIEAEFPPDGGTRFVISLPTNGTAQTS